MGTHPQIPGIKALIYLNQIQTFEDIFNKHGFPHTVMALAMGTNNNRMRSLIQNPRGFYVHEIEEIAAYFDVPLSVMVELIVCQITKINYHDTKTKNGIKETDRRG